MIAISQKPSAGIVEELPPAFQGHPRLEIYPRLRHGGVIKWYWRFVAGNGHVLARGRDSGFTEPANAVASYEIVASRRITRARSAAEDSPWAWAISAADELPVFLVAA